MEWPGSARPSLVVVDFELCTVNCICECERECGFVSLEGNLTVAGS